LVKIDVHENQLGMVLTAECRHVQIIGSLIRTNKKLSLFNLVDMTVSVILHVLDKIWSVPSLYMAKLRPRAWALQHIILHPAMTVG